MTLPLGDNGRPGGGGIDLPLGDNGRSGGAPSGRSGAGRRASVGAAGCSGGRPPAVGRALEITRDDASWTSASAAGASCAAAAGATSAGAGASCAGAGAADAGASCAGAGLPPRGPAQVPARPVAPPRRREPGRRTRPASPPESRPTWSARSARPARQRRCRLRGCRRRLRSSGVGRRFGGRCSSDTGLGRCRVARRRFVGHRCRRGIVGVVRDGVLLGGRLLLGSGLLGGRLLGGLGLFGLFVACQPVALGATGHHVGVRLGERGRRALGSNAEHTAEVEDLGVRHPELFRELVDPDLLRSHVVDSTFHSRLCLADAGINAHPDVRHRRPLGRRGR
jgi:hypothetical protein